MMLVLPDAASAKNHDVAVPHDAVACGNVMIVFVLEMLAGVVTGSVPDDAAAGANAENRMTSVPTLATELLHVTPFAGVPIMVTVVLDGTWAGVVISKTCIPTVTHEGSAEKVMVEPVAEVAVTLPATWTRAYEPPVTSVAPLVAIEPVSEVGAVVNKPSHSPVGRAGITRPPVQ